MRAFAIGLESKEKSYRGALEVVNYLKSSKNFLLTLSKSLLKEIFKI